MGYINQVSLTSVKVTASSNSRLGTANYDLSSYTRETCLEPWGFISQAQLLDKWQANNCIQSDKAW